MKLLLIVSALFVFVACKAQPQPKLSSGKDENTLLWEISGKGLKQPSYLFGTFHMMCKDDIQFSDNLLNAIQYSKEVYFEMDLDDAANTLGAMFFMNMKDGKTLRDFYTEEEYLKLETYFLDSLRTSLKTFHKMKPSFLEAFLYPKMMPCKNMSGVEQELLKIAAKDKKEIKGFETIAFQVSVFDSIPYDVQAKSLLKTIDSIDAYKVQFGKMVKVYKMQQIDQLEAMFTDETFGIKDGLDVLLDKRNINWVEQLKTILPNNNIFMAVGAGHLVGKKGLIELLRKEGYELRPISNDVNSAKMN
jgi:uncharacterized protein YbaP (TraB family)